MNTSHGDASTELSRLQQLFSLPKSGSVASSTHLGTRAVERQNKTRSPGRFASSQSPAHEQEKWREQPRTPPQGTSQRLDHSSYKQSRTRLSTASGGDIHIAMGAQNSWGNATQPTARFESESLSGSMIRGDPHEAFVRQEETLQNVTARLMLDLDNAKREVSIQYRKAMDYIQKLSEPLRFAPANGSTSHVSENASHLTQSSGNGGSNYSLSTLITDSGLSISLKDFHSLSMLRAPALQADPFGPFIQLLQGFPEHESLSTQNIRQALAETDEQMRSLQKAVDDADQRRDCALNAEENVPVGEYYYQQVVGLLTEMLTLVRKRIHVVAGEGRQAEVQETFQRKLNEFYELIQRHETANQHLKIEIQKDLNRIRDHGKRIAHQQQVEAEEFERRKGGYTVQLEQNQKKQLGAWARISQALEEIQQLSLDRNSLLMSLINDAETHQHHAQNSRALHDLSTHHTHSLESILHELNQFDVLFEEARACGGDAERRLLQRIREVGCLLKDIRLDEHRNHLSVFRRYAITVGDYLFRRDKRVGDIISLVKSLSMQREIARDVLDRHGEQYVGDIHQLEEEKSQILKEISVLRRDLDLAVREFEPTETVLREAHVHFVHPAQQLAEHLQQQEQHITSIRKKYELH